MTRAAPGSGSQDGFPRLSGHAVLRIFVLTAPFFMLAMVQLTRRSWTEALLAAGAFSLLLVNVAVMMIVGRSDATLLCETVLAYGLTQQLLVTRHRHWTNKHASRCSSCWRLLGGDVPHHVAYDAL